MKSETLYKYQKRIRELERENNALREYKAMSIEIFRACCDQASGGKNIDPAWIVRQYTRVFR